jgi:hypothetical protein
MTSTYLPTYKCFPVAKPAELDRVMVQTYTEMATQINYKENGQYEQVETNTGEQFYNLTNPKIKRFVFRKAIELPPILTGTIVNIPHNIPLIVDMANIYGTVYTETPDWRPIPSVGPWGTDLLSVWVTAVHIHIESGQTFPNILSGRVILEYFKN